jgi:uncharacterized protein (TIGR02118 family)
MNGAMVSLFAMFRKPDDTEEFEKHFRTVRVPLVRKYPGLIRHSITRVDPDTPDHERWYLIEEMVFESRDSMDAALASAEGKAVTRDLLHFAARIVSITFGTSETESMP